MGAFSPICFLSMSSIYIFRKLQRDSVFSLGPGSKEKLEWFLFCSRLKKVKSIVRVENWEGQFYSEEKKIEVALRFVVSVVFETVFSP